MDNIANIVDLSEWLGTADAGNVFFGPKIETCCHQLPLLVEVVALGLFCHVPRSSWPADFNKSFQAMRVSPGCTCGSVSGIGWVKHFAVTMPLALRWVLLSFDYVSGKQTHFPHTLGCAGLVESVGPIVLQKIGTMHVASKVPGASGQARFHVSWRIPHR